MDEVYIVDKIIITSENNQYNVIILNITSIKIYGWHATSCSSLLSLALGW